MEIKEQHEIEQLIKGSNRILLATRGNPGFDDIASALAWRLALKQSGIERVDVMSDIPEEARGRFKFLPGFAEVKYSIQAAEYFVIQVNVAKTKAKELSYDLIGDTLEIRVKPENGNFSSKDVSFKESAFSYDLVITLGAPEFAALGRSFEDSRELFFHTPTVNVDRSSANVRYGQVNAVYLTATSLAELIYPLVKGRMDKDIASCLLTGLISATNSFQTPQVTPDTLKLASELIVAGASREDIVTQLYRTKDMDKLRLWGKVLSRLEQQSDRRVVYSHLTHEDVGDLELNLQEMVDELVLASPEAHVVIFFYEVSATETRVWVYGRENYDLPLMFQKFNPQGQRRLVRFTHPKNAADAEHEILDHVKEQLKLINF